MYLESQTIVFMVSVLFLAYQCHNYIGPNDSNFWDSFCGFAGFNEDTGILPDEEDPGSDEDVEIEIVEDEPAFLRGQTKLSMHLSPIKIVKVSD